MKKVRKILAVAGLAMLTAVSLSAQPSTPIDTFTAPSQTVQANSGTPSAADSGSDPSILGGERDIAASWISGASNIDVQAGTVGLFEFSGGALALGSGSAVWDGSDGSSAVDCASGLGGVDISTGSDDRIRLNGFTNDFGVDVTVTLYTDCSNFCSRTQAQPPLQTGVVVDFLYSDFTTCTGTLDLTSINAIQLQIGPTASTATDVTLDMITTPVELSAFSIE